MLEYLEKLVEDKEYQKALDYAEQLLLNSENKAWDLMSIYSLLLEARYATGEFYGAQVAGQLALKMARELEAWDYFGSVALPLGVCYDRLNQQENALAAWYDYVAYVPHYKAALKHHVLVLYNIGVVSGQNGQPLESLRMLQKAADVADAYKDDRGAHGIRHAMIDAHLRYGELELIPNLLAKCAHYLRHNPTAFLHGQSLLWHVVLRVRYAVATNRPNRALRVARHGLRIAQDLPETAEMVYHLHFLSAKCFEQIGDLRKSFAEGVRARASAVEVRRFDLEFEIMNYIYGLLVHHPDLVEHLQDSSSESWDPQAIK